jgi:CheY-like chemotaxis protein
MIQESGALYERGDRRMTDRSACHILIVDDDSAIREALTEILEDEGYQISIAPHGAAALEYLRQTPQRPNLILLDLMMPVMSGWEFRAEQQRDPDLAGIPVIVLSADRSLQVRSGAVPADAYVAKPVDLDPFLKLIGSYCT